MLRESFIASLFMASLLSASLHAQTHGGTSSSSTTTNGYNTASVNLAWNPNPPGENVTDYELTWSFTEEAFIKANDDDPVIAAEGHKLLTNTIQSTRGATVATLKNLPNDRKIYFGVRAVNRNGKSDFATISTTTDPYVPDAPPPPSIQNLKVVDANGKRNVSLDLVGGLEGKKYTVQISENLTDWTDVSSVVMGEDGEVVTFPFQWPLTSAPPKMFFRFKYME